MADFAENGSDRGHPLRVVDGSAAGSSQIITTQKASPIATNAMPRFFYQWTPAIIQHLADNDVTPEEFMHVVENNRSKMFSDSSGNPATRGWLPDGRRLFCSWRMIDDIEVEPVTAFKIGER